jgi:hypothetical protein
VHHNQNLFSVTGQFDAETIVIRQSKQSRITIIFDPLHAEKIASLRNGQTVTATGQICSPRWNQVFTEDPSPADTVLNVKQIITFSSNKNIELEGQFDAKIVRWHEGDGMFAICKTLGGETINCYVPAVHERLAKARPDHMAGMYLRFYCSQKDGCLVAQKIKIIDVPPAEILAIAPNKACQAWDEFIKEGKPRSQLKSARQISAKLRRSIFMRDGFRCRECGASPENEHVYIEIDHIIPFSRGGNSEEKNLQTLCSKCNGAKSDGMPNPATMEALIA